MITDPIYALTPLQLYSRIVAWVKYLGKLPFHDLMDVAFSDKFIPSVVYRCWDEGNLSPKEYAGDVVSSGRSPFFRIAHAFALC